MKTFMVFDVESIGLHGEGFSVGYVVIDERGIEYESGYFHSDPKKALGTNDNLNWVLVNVTPHIDFLLSYNCELASSKQIRERFWERFQIWQSKGALLAADCSWPVEARFLIACVNDDCFDREWKGPYPLIDISSVRFAKGLDPLETIERKEDELPAHNPLADARQSARLLIEALNEST